MLHLDLPRTAAFRRAFSHIDYRFWPRVACRAAKTGTPSRRAECRLCAGLSGDLSNQALNAMMPRMTRQTFIHYVLECRLRTLRSRLLMSFVIEYVSAGFVQATVFSTAYRSFSERITNGIAESFMGTILYGTACCEFGNGINLWPYIALNTALVFFIWMVVRYSRESPPRSVGGGTLPLFHSASDRSPAMISTVCRPQLADQRQWLSERLADTAHDHELSRRRRAMQRPPLCELTPRRPRLQSRFIASVRFWGIR